MVSHKLQSILGKLRDEGSVQCLILVLHELFGAGMECVKLEKAYTFASLFMQLLFVITSSEKQTTSIHKLHKKRFIKIEVSPY